MTTWGAWSSNDRLRAGLDMSYSPSVGTGTSAVTVSYTLSGQTRYASNESGTGVTDFALSGSYSRTGSMNGWNEGAMGTWTVASGSFSVSTSYTSAITVTLNGNYTSGGAYPGTKPTVSMSITIPKRPYSLPAAPSSCAKTRVSDTSHTVTWTRNATTGAPYDNLYLERSVDGGAWTARATLAGTATSYSDTTTSANHTYAWRIRAKNSAGYSGYSTSTTIKTTPAASGTPTAAKDASGNIVVTWGGNSAIGENIEVWHAANGVWDASPLATVGMVTSYTHTAPVTTVTHTYKTRTKIASPALTSAYSANSNVVQLLTAPAAPTNLSPSGTPRDATQSIATTWTHNPLDTTPQTKFQRQWRVNGGAWTVGSITTGTAGGSFSAGTFTNGSTVEWQVRTWGSATTGGSDGTGASPWSASATFVTSSPPSAVINSPGSGQWAASKLTTTWSYSDPEGSAQAAWIVKLYTSVGGSVLETKTGAGTDSSVTLSTRVADGGSYAVGVQVQDSTGMWSPEVTKAFTVSYAKPPAASMALNWVPDDGVVQVAITNPDPTASRTNYATNPSFETGTTGWAAGGGLLTLSQTSDYALIGDYAMLAIANASTAAGAAYVTHQPAYAAGRLCTISAYVTAVTPGTFHMMLQFRNASNVPIGPNYTGPSVFLDTGDVRRLSASAGSTVAPAGTTTVLVWIVREEASVVGDGFAVDAVLVENDDTVNPYMEGTVNEVPAEWNQLWRSIAGGDWVLVADNVGVNATVTDYIPALEAANSYRVVSATSAPSSITSVPQSITTSGAKHVFVNAGTGFGSTLKVKSNVEIGITFGRARRERRAAGREYPVTHDGTQRHKEIEVSALIWNPRLMGDRASTASKWAEIEAFADLPSPACYRDLEGNRVFVTMGDVKISNIVAAARTASWSLSQSDYVEPTEATQ